MKIIGIIIAIAVIALGGYYLFMGADNGVLDYGGGEDVADSGDFAGIFVNAKNISSVKYDLLITSPGEAINFVYYQKDNKIRVEREDNGNSIIGIANHDEGLYYSILVSENIAVELTEEQVNIFIRDSLRDQSKILSRTDLKEVGKETLKGKETIVFEYKYSDGQTVTIWVWEEYGIPVKSSTYVDGGGEIVTELSNIEFVEISDEMFVLPEGVNAININ